MKQWLITVISLVFLFGCGNVEESQEPKEDQVAKVEQNEVEKDQQPTESTENDSEEPSDTPEPNEDTINEVKEPVEPQYTINSIYSVVPIDDAEKRVALLTIDDTPDKYGLEIAKTLKDLGVNAIFFVNGHFIDTEEEKEILKEIHHMGFAIGNHTMSHPNLQKISQEEQLQEIVQLNDKIEEIIGERPKFFRAPFGANTDYALRVVEDEKMVQMKWSFGYDYFQEYMNKEALTDITLNTNLLGSGANILMHDREWTLQALPDIVKGLQEKGFQIVDPHLIKTPE